MIAVTEMHLQSLPACNKLVIEGKAGVPAFPDGFALPVRRTKLALLAWVVADVDEGSAPLSETGSNWSA